MNQKTAMPEEAAKSTASSGILWMILATFLSVTLDAIVKHLVQSYSVVQVVWARYGFHMLLLIIVLRGRLLQTLSTRRLDLQCLRSVTLFLTTVLTTTCLC